MKIMRNGIEYELTKEELLMAHKEYECLCNTKSCEAKFYYTFGTDPQFPYYRGYVEVHAENICEANEKFRKRFPDRHEGTLNCAFVYDEKSFNRMIKRLNNERGSDFLNTEKCHEIIT